MTRISMPSCTFRRLSVKTSAGFISLHSIYYWYYTMQKQFCQVFFEKIRKTATDIITCFAVLVYLLQPAYIIIYILDKIFFKRSTGFFADIAVHCVKSSFGIHKNIWDRG